MATTQEFIVEITTTPPDDPDPAAVTALRAAEAVRAKELAATGNLVRLWRPVGELRSWDCGASRTRTTCA